MTTIQPPATCENCSREIGRLEPRYTWQNHLVCGECFTRLSTPVAPPLAAAPAAPHIPATPVASATSTPAPAASAEKAEPAVPPESILFNGHPSLLTALGGFSLAATMLLLGLFLVLFTKSFLFYFGSLLALAGLVLWIVKYLQIKFIHYRLSSQRLFITTGILSKKTIEVELFRVRDLSVSQSLLQRLLRIGSIHAVTTDSDVPQLNFDGIKDPFNAKELLRHHVMESRQRTRTRDLDISDLPDSR